MHDISRVVKHRAVKIRDPLFPSHCYSGKSDREETEGNDTNLDVLKPV